MSSQIWVTNESTSLSRAIGEYFGEDVITYDSSLDFFRTYSSMITKQKEISSFDPTLIKLINRYETDVIIHSSPMSVEQIIDNPSDAIRILLEGAWRIGEIVKKSNIQLIHVNLPVYTNVGEKNTLLYFLNSTIKNIYDILDIQYIVLNPPILYSEGMDNLLYSLIWTDENRRIYIDAENDKPFIHVDDFVKILSRVLSGFDFLKRDWFDVPPSEILPFEEVLDMCEIYHGIYDDKDLYLFEDLQDIKTSPIMKVDYSHNIRDTIKRIKEIR